MLLPCRDESPILFIAFITFYLLLFLKFQFKFISKRTPKMSNDNETQENEIQMLIKIIEECKNNLREISLIRLPKKNEQQLLDVRLRLCSKLPGISDLSLSEIDYLIIPDNSQPVVTSTTTNSGGSMALLLKTSLSLYKVIHRYDHDFHSISTLILLAAQFEGKEDEIKTIEKYAHKLLVSLDVTKVCLALKLLRIAMDKPNNLISRLIRINDVAWMCSLKNIPQAICPKKQKISSWISRQAKIILDRLDMSWFPNLQHKFSTWKLDPESYVCTLMANDFKPSFLKIDHIYSYFDSANNENEKVKLIESFVKGCVKVHMKQYNYFAVNILSKINFFRLLQELVQDSLCYLFEMMNKHLYLEAEWKKIEKYHVIHLEPYLSENSNSPAAQSSDCQQMRETFLNLETNDEPDLAIEKYLYYHVFIKCFRLINILHTTFLRSGDILKLKIPDDHESWIFRSKKPTFRNYIKDCCNSLILRNAETTKMLPWIKIAIIMCPVLVMSRNHEYLKKDLLKLLDGEDLDETILEELYFAVNSNLILY